jgi:hypothetical protein
MIPTETTIGYCKTEIKDPESDDRQTYLLSQLDNGLYSAYACDLHGLVEQMGLYDSIEEISVVLSLDTNEAGLPDITAAPEWRLWAIPNKEVVQTSDGIMAPKNGIPLEVLFISEDNALAEKQEDMVVRIGNEIFGMNSGDFTLYSDSSPDYYQVYPYESGLSISTPGEQGNYRVISTPEHEHNDIVSFGVFENYSDAEAAITEWSHYDDLCFVRENRGRESHKNMIPFARNQHGGYSALIDNLEILSEKQSRAGVMETYSIGKLSDKSVTEQNLPGVIKGDMFNELGKAANAYAVLIIENQAAKIQQQDNDNQGIKQDKASWAPYNMLINRLGPDHHSSADLTASLAKKGVSDRDTSAFFKASLGDPDKYFDINEGGNFATTPPPERINLDAFSIGPYVSKKTINDVNESLGSDALRFIMGEPHYQHEQPLIHFDIKKDAVENWVDARYSQTPEQAYSIALNELFSKVPEVYQAKDIVSEILPDCSNYMDLIADGLELRDPHMTIIEARSQIEDRAKQLQGAKRPEPEKPVQAAFDFDVEPELANDDYDHQPTM